MFQTINEGETVFFDCILAVENLMKQIKHCARRKKNNIITC